MEAIKYKVTEIEVQYINKQKAVDRPKINTSADAFTYLLDGFNMNTIAIQEQFVVMYMNVSNKVLGLYRASSGGITGTVADIRLILSVALKIGATCMVLAHNHPSGALKPSSADEELTRKIKESAKLMDVKVLDHLIIAPNGTEYFSFADEGLV